MTAEHIPARSAGNEGEVRERPPAQDDVGLDALQKWADGFALPTLCDPCNANGSRWRFTNEYAAWRKCAIDSMQRHCVEQGRERPAQFVAGELIKLTLDYDRMPGRFARYVVGLFLTTQRDEGLLAANPRLSATVTASEGGSPPGGCVIAPSRLFLALCNRQNLIQRNTALMARIGVPRTTDGGLLLPAPPSSTTDFQLLVVSPFALTLVISGEPPAGCGIEITGWTELDHHHRFDVRTELEVPILDFPSLPE